MSLIVFIIGLSFIYGGWMSYLLGNDTPSASGCVLFGDVLIGISWAIKYLTLERHFLEALEKERSDFEKMIDETLEELKEP